jgi:hypothetical protein
MGTDVNGLPSPEERAGDGRYHIPGLLTTAPPTILKKVLEVCSTLAETIKQSNVLLVCPIALTLHTLKIGSRKTLKTNWLTVKNNTRGCWGGGQ